MAVVYTLAQTYTRQNITEGIAPFLWFIFSSHALLLPTAPILIRDTLTQQQNTVVNAPWSLALVASSISAAGNTLRIAAHNIFMPPQEHNSLPNIMGPYTPCKLIRLPPPQHIENVTTFINRCIIQEALIGARITFDDLLNTPNLWKTIRTQANKCLGMYWIDKHNQKRSFLSCQEAASRFEKEIISSYSSFFKATFSSPSHLLAAGSGAMTLEHFAQHTAKASNQSLMHFLLCHTLSSKIPSGLELPQGYAQMQQHWSSQLTLKISEDFLPALKTLLEVLAYASFCIVAILSLLPRGWRTLCTFTGLLLWIQSWPFFSSILHSVIGIYTYQGTLEYTLANLPSHLTAHQHILDIAAMFTLSIPPLSYLILKGGAGAIVHLAQHMNSQIQQATSQASSLLSSGNIQFGNTGINNSSSHNISSFHAQNNPVTSGGAFQYTAQDGSQITQFENGNMRVLQSSGSTFSQLAFSIEASKGISSQLNIESQKAYQRAEETGQAIMESTSALHEIVSSQVESTSQEQRDSDSTSNNLNYLEKSGIQDITSFAEKLEDSYGLSKQAAQRISWGMSMSIPLPLLLGPSFQNQGEHSSSEQETTSQISSLASTHNLQKSWETLTALSAQQQTTNATASLQSQAKSANHHIQNLQQAMQTFQENISVSSRLSNASNIMSTSSQTLHHDQTNAFLLFAQSRINTSLHRTASLLNENPILREQLTHEFIQDQVQSAMENLHNKKGP